MTDVLRIEDDDGFVTEWPWPEGKLILAHPEFMEIFEAAHKDRRDEWEKESHHGNKP